MNTQLQAYLRLTRPPNLLTAVSDIWAGAALADSFTIIDKDILALVLLSLSSVFLYAGGIVMNDVCDAELDAVERPERPIPAGVLSKTSAAYFGFSLLVIGVCLAAVTGLQSGIIAFLVAVCSLIYDRWAKPHFFFGPLVMGFCRGLNLLMGMSILALNQVAFPWLAIVPVLYIAAVTLISRGEVHGGNRSSVVTAMIIYLLVVAAIVTVGIWQQRIFITSIFLLLFVLFIFPPLLKAIRTLSGKYIGKAVKAGVLGLILMNAAWVSAGASVGWAVITALLLPVSILIARRFQVT